MYGHKNEIQVNIPHSESAVRNLLTLVLWYYSRQHKVHKVHK